MVNKVRTGSKTYLLRYKVSRSINSDRLLLVKFKTFSIVDLIIFRRQHFNLNMLCVTRIAKIKLSNFQNQLSSWIIILFLKTSFFKSLYLNKKWKFLGLLIRIKKLMCMIFSKEKLF